MKNKALVFWLAVLLVFAGAMTLWMAYRHLVGTSDIETAGATTTADTEVPPRPRDQWLKDFELTDQNGQPFDSQQLDGRVWVASFFFANCPQICRMQNMQVAKLQQKYAGRGLQLVSITCDPLRDTPPALANYAAMFNADPQHWHFLTGDLAYIKRIGVEFFQVAVEEETHSDRVMVLDRTGKILGSYRSTQPDQFAKLQSQLDQLLAERPAASGETDGPAEQPSPDAVEEESAAAPEVPAPAAEAQRQRDAPAGD